MRWQGNKAVREVAFYEEGRNRKESSFCLKGFRAFRKEFLCGLR